MELIVAMLAAAALAGAPPQAGDCNLESTDVRAVRAVATGIIDADNARDIERVLGFYAADAMLMPPGESVVTGRDAIRPRYEKLFAAFNPQIEARVDEACVDGGIAFVRGHNGGRLAPRQTGEPRLLDDAYLMLLRRDPDGAWRISHLMWHPASAAPRVGSGR